jgi:isopenicillin N synthase-like dioxygenase
MLAKLHWRWCIANVFVHLSAAQAKDAIPVIDIAAWTNATYNEIDRSQIVVAVGKAAAESGFFAIRNHGISHNVIEDALTASRMFFDLPIDVKSQYKSTNETDYPYGYENTENLARGKYLTTSHDVVVDAKETFAIGPHNPLAGMPPRRFPHETSGLAQTMTRYYESMEGLASVLLEICAVALGLPSTWFYDKMDRHVCALRLLNYPRVENGRQGQIRASAHTDYGALTILYSGGPGLQVKKDMDGEDWLDVQDSSDTFIVNLGDMMQRWTNGKCANCSIHTRIHQSIHAHHELTIQCHRVSSVCIVYSLAHSITHSLVFSHSHFHIHIHTLSFSYTHTLTLAIRCLGINTPSSRCSTYWSHPSSTKHRILCQHEPRLCCTATRSTTQCHTKVPSNHCEGIRSYQAPGKHGNHSQCARSYHAL